MTTMLPAKVYQMCVHGAYIVGSYAKHLSGENADKIKEYQKERLKNDPVYKARVIARKRTRRFIKDPEKNKYSITKAMRQSLGTNIQEYLKSLFYDHPETGEKMTWNNWTFEGWHLDHIIPHCMFDAENEEHMRICWDRRNLRPCWAFENLSKGNKILPHLLTPWHHEQLKKLGIELNQLAS